MKKKTGLFDKNSGADEHGYIRRDGVSDYILKEARSKYGGEITKEDIFYYVYGFLHSSDYRKAFANDLKKSLPRLPLVRSRCPRRRHSRRRGSSDILHQTLKRT